MAYSYVVYTGNGATTQYSVPFPYIRKEHVYVSINYTNTTAFTWVNASTIQMNSAPANGARVEVRRTTPVTAPLVDFADGSTLVAADLDTVNLQQTYINQEQDDQFQDAVFINSQGNLDAGGKRITNVGAPTAAQDAVTKAYTDNWFGTYGESYLGSYATDPATKPNGGALTVGVWYFNTAANRIKIYNGQIWTDGASPSGIVRWKKTAAGGETSLSGADDNSFTLAYTPALEQLYINGALQTRAVDYLATNGTSVTGLAPLTAGDVVEVLSFNNWVAATVPDASVTNAKVATGAGIAASKLSFTQAGTGAVERTIDGKLKEVISVKDFGAIGDGTTDDTAAIKAALTAADGGFVFVPTGIYRITSPLDTGVTAQIRLIGPSSAFFSHGFVATAKSGTTDFTETCIDPAANLAKRFATIKCDNTNLLGALDGASVGSKSTLRHLENLCVYGVNGAKMGAYLQPQDALIQNCHFALFEWFGVCIRGGITSTINKCSFSDNGWNLSHSGSASYPATYLSGCAINVVSNYIASDFATVVSPNAATTLSIENVFVWVRAWTGTNQSGYRGLQVHMCRGLNVDNFGSYTGNYFYFAQGSVNNIYVENYATKGLTTSDNDPRCIYSFNSSLSLNTSFTTNNAVPSVPPIYVNPSAQSDSPNVVQLVSGKQTATLNGAITGRWDAEITTTTPGSTVTYNLYPNTLPPTVGFTGFLIVRLVKDVDIKDYYYACFFVHKHNAGGAGVRIGSPVSVATGGSLAGFYAATLSALTLASNGSIQFDVTWGGGWSASEKWRVNFALIGLDGFSSP